MVQCRPSPHLCAVAKHCTNKGLTLDLGLIDRVATTGFQPLFFLEIKMTSDVKVIAKSICIDTPITTFQLKYPRFIHGELMTHRVFSRNASSSRAIPVRKLLAQVWNDPVVPIHWGANQAGMQAKGQLVGWRLAVAKFLWLGASKAACVFVWGLSKAGLHKQVANRILEPWQWMHTILTATDWDNFYELRCHPDAQPEIFQLATMMYAADVANRARQLSPGEWHLPYIKPDEFGLDTEVLKKMSAARCARVSYLTHDGKEPNQEQDLALFDRLASGRPVHASPLEHQATPADGRYANFTNWKQFRAEWEKSL